MHPILTFARLTIWESSRRKLLLALVALTLAIIILSSWGFSRLWTVTSNGQPIGEVEVRAAASQLLIGIAFMFSAVLALSSVMVAAPSISADVESGLLLSLLARPVRRLDVALGKWLGLALLVACYAAGAGGLEMLGVYIATGYVPPNPVQLVIYIAGEGMVLLTLALALSTRMAGMTGGIVGLVAYFVAWIGGILGGFGQAFSNDSLQVASLVTKLLIPTDVLWRGAVYAMEPASVLAATKAAGRISASNPFWASDPPPVPLLAWAALWVLGVLALAWWGFRRREV